jgi:hypothetical protein
MPDARWSKATFAGLLPEWNLRPVVDALQAMRGIALITAVVLVAAKRVKSPTSRLLDRLDSGVAARVAAHRTLSCRAPIRARASARSI